MDYEKLKEVIAKQIKENGRQEITGPVLQAILMAMVDSLGEVYPQTYTEEQKAQARANIDALSNYDGEITKAKLAQSIQDTLNKVGMNIKVLPDGTDLLSQQEIRETGLYLTISDGTYKNFPPFTDKSSPVLLIVTNNGTHRYAFGQKNFWLAFNFSYGSSWYGYDMENVLKNKVSVVNSLTDTEVNNIWDNN